LLREEIGKAGIVVAILVLIFLLAGVVLLLYVSGLGAKLMGIMLICIASMVGGAYTRSRARRFYY
jgi:uncharacterized RDD family membrane protein YckC